MRGPFLGWDFANWTVGDANIDWKVSTEEKKRRGAGELRGCLVDGLFGIYIPRRRRCVTLFT